MSIPHSPTGFVNQASLDNAFTVPINDLAAAASLGEYGRASSGTGVTLATIHRRRRGQSGDVHARPPPAGSASTCGPRTG
jgi:hypothetical protein